MEYWPNLDYPTYLCRHTVACTTYEELLDAVDGSIIYSPSNVHTTVILKAIQAKKTILAEKPIVTTDSDCSLILEALELEPVFNMVGYDLRFSKQILELRRLIKENMGFVRKRIAKPVPVFGSFSIGKVENFLAGNDIFYLEIICFF